MRASAATAPETADDLRRLAALVHVCAALPCGDIVRAYPIGEPGSWYDIVDGLPAPTVKDAVIDVWDRPGIGVEFTVRAARAHVMDEDHSFFD
jgi:L-alanine-DL-glutamate epimerase-like enolase superfamily enzyme